MKRMILLLAWIAIPLAQPAAADERPANSVPRDAQPATRPAGELLRSADPKSEGPAAPPQPTSRTVRDIEGWSVRVDDRLLAAPNEELGTKALRFLEAKLSEIKIVVRPERVKEALDRYGLRDRIAARPSPEEDARTSDHGDDN